MRNNTFHGMTLIAFLSLAFTPTLLGQVMSSEEEALLWRKLYSDPIVSQDLRHSHGCDSCWGKCLKSTDVANCCGTDICIGVCDSTDDDTDDDTGHHTHCIPSEMTGALALTVISCSIKCKFKAQH